MLAPTAGNPKYFVYDDGKAPLIKGEKDGRLDS